MACSYALMRNASAPALRFFTVCLISGFLASGQQQAVDPPKGARAVLDLSEPEQIRFIEATMEQSFPEDRADEMTMLIINRSAVALPLIESKLEQVLNSPSPSKRFIDVASEMIAYAGDEQSLRAISNLIRIDEPRFGRLVGRTLDAAGNWRNPFSVVYRAFDLGDDSLARYAIDWADSALESVRVQRVWAEAMLDKYGRVPATSDWAHDPIASRLRSERASRLKERVLGVASEVQRSRSQRQ